MMFFRYPKTLMLALISDLTTGVPLWAVVGVKVSKDSYVDFDIRPYYSFIYRGMLLRTFAMKEEHFDFVDVILLCLQQAENPRQSNQDVVRKQMA
ncbi:hypothetical protein O9G_000015 [Rozella allomycis CSF55]|uniref:Uncharacterized protein n=1 Tax=Rozella allomycis (strain CSF55) TaxID=988480 RepID=A0A075ANR7_ROZAC|nr:hypothetical protein O9G_000015 [Rozella allomycis CSF55]|eukprot:EPZ31539.1 hypothetical protein O9G_000015 [Rozella allomycis CSF55]